MNAQSSGTWTNRVMTWHVILYPGSAKSLARPKSASLSCPSEAMSKLFGFKSYNRHRAPSATQHRIPNTRLPYAELSEDKRTRWRMKFLWQNSSPRKVIAIHALMSAGKKTSVRSLMIISRSLSKNSRTRLRFVFEENTSMSWRWVGTV